MPFTLFDDDFFLDQARWIAELSHSDVKMEIHHLDLGKEWQVVYRFRLCYITLRFKVGIGDSEPLIALGQNLLLEWEHFRVSPRHHGVGRKFAEIFLEELKLTPVNQVVLHPKNESAERFWRAVGFKPVCESTIDFKGYLYMDLSESISNKISDNRLFLT